MYIIHRIGPGNTSLLHRTYVAKGYIPIPATLSRGEDCSIDFPRDSTQSIQTVVHSGKVGVLKGFLLTKKQCELLRGIARDSNERRRFRPYLLHVAAMITYQIRP
jgi:hypothetical protein